MYSNRKFLSENVACVLAIFSFILISATSNSQSLVGHWTFEEGTELQDLTGNFSDLVLQSGATISNGQLDVGPGQWANAVGYTGPAITEKTLLSWVYLEDLDVKAGSILTIDQTDNDQFDGIVYAEREDFRWMAGSNYYERTQDPLPGYAETATEELVLMAISYENVGGSARVRIYHNGTLIGDYTQGSIATWSGANTEVVFGARHTISNTIRGEIDGRIEEAQIYDGVLTEEQINDIFYPAQVPTISQWGFMILILLFLIIGVVTIKERKFIPFNLNSDQ